MTTKKKSLHSFTNPATIDNKTSAAQANRIFNEPLKEKPNVTRPVPKRRKK